MSNTELIVDICNAFGMSSTLATVYGLNTDWFDKNQNELENLFKTLIGPHKGEIAFKIYKSKTENT